MALFNKILPSVFFLLILSSCAGVKTPTANSENNATDLPQNTPTIATSTITPANPTSTITVAPTSIANGTQLSWNEVLFYDSDPANYDAEREDITRISILRNQQDVDQESKWIRSINIQQVRSVDFSTYDVIMIYAGREPETKYRIKIDEIRKKERSIYLVVTIAGAPNGEIRSPSVTSPYLVITLNKSDVPDQATFILISNGKEVDQKTVSTAK